MSLVIGFAGKAGAGKDTAANILAHLLRKEGYPVYRTALAGPVKAGLAAMGLAEPKDRNLREVPLEGLGFTYRKAAQTLGTEWGRSLHPDIWLQLLKLRVADFSSRHPGGITIISDIRFENEAAFVREHGQIFHVRGRESEVNGVTGHASEAGIAQKLGDYFLENSGSLQALEVALSPAKAWILRSYKESIQPNPEWTSAAN